jgi:hypothetical protein
MAWLRSAQLARHLLRHRRPVCHDRPVDLVLDTGVGGVEGMDTGCRLNWRRALAVLFPGTETLMRLG